ncbi:methyl-accepting chemotaxis protein [Arcobacter sp. YIC-464]|uniref:methyl-accepting chemotaxis protein n=1 Tax=Arcobacter sp. YIC-464 TaxID=3376631 RepID=UPI003C132BC7
MNFLKNLPIKKKLLVSIIIPMLAVLVVSSILLFQGYIKYKNYVKLETLMSLNASISHLVHETQKERGATAGYIGSKGAKFKDILANQRELTNQKLKDLNSYISSNNLYSILNEKNANRLKNILNEIGKVNSIRGEVDGFNISLKNALGYYTNLNSMFLKYITLTSKQSLDNEIAIETMAYYTFLESKERAGIERAVGSAIFGANNLIPGFQARFITLIAQQDAYMNSFETLATKELIDFKDATIQGESVNEVNRLRKLIITNNDGQGNFNVDATYWFKTITKKINLLKKTDDYLSEKIISDTLIKEKEALNKFIMLTVFLVLVIAITLFIASYNTRTIIDSIMKIRNGIEIFFDFMNRKRNTFDHIDVKTKGELGEIAQFINKNLETLERELEQDMKCVGEAILVLNKLEQGSYHNQVMSMPANPQIKTFAKTINKMLVNQETLMNNILDELDKYTNYNYLSKINNDNIHGETKKLIDGINALGEAITAMLRENKSNGDVLSQNSQELSSNVEHLNSSALSQAASIEETAASIEETTASIREISSQAITMQELSKETLTYANEGKNLAQKTQNSMEEINNATQEINEAITIIDQIAFQTNILSLNAAVEAATAGEAGKGFAVVAQEVRNLAGRSADAAREIKELVEKANLKASEGKNSSEMMIEGFSKLNEKIENTSEIISSVTNSTQEQSRTISQINEAITKIDQLTQENAKVATNAKDIASKTNDIALEIIKNTDSKQFN